MPHCNPAILALTVADLLEVNSLPFSSKSLNGAWSQELMVPEAHTSDPLIALVGPQGQAHLSHCPQGLRTL